MAAYILGACQSPRESELEPAPWPLIYAQDFDLGDSLSGFAFSDAAKWTWSSEDGNGFLELTGPGPYEPPQRSPRCIALLPRLVLGDFDLEVDLLQTGRDYGHRDLCLFFGFQSPKRFYYAHLASSPDENAHNLFKVEDAPRASLAPVAAQGVDWGRGRWHRVRLERRVDSGIVRVFWDDQAQPILEVKDRRFDWGRLGVGSFDDSGRIDRIRVWAPGERRMKLPPQPFR